MTARSAIVGAVMWCVVIIAAVLVWNQPRDVDDDGSAPSNNPDDTTTSSVVERRQDDRTAPTLPAQQIPDFTFEECMGEDFGLVDLKGKPWVVSFIFTRCITTCPQITLAMKNLHDRIAEQNPDVMFVTMTVDSDHDTAAILERYSETFQPDRDRWKFLTGDLAAMHDLIVNGFGVYVKENIGDARRPGMEVAHSNRVVLVDPDGFPAGKFLGTKPEDMADLARILSGRKPFPDPLPRLQFSVSGADAAGVEVQLVPAETSDDQPEDADASETRAPAATGQETDAAGASTSEMQHEPELSTALRLAKIDRLLPDWAKALPTANAILNSTSTVLLGLGWLAIRRGHRNTHRNFMISAFVVSTAFLGCYLTSHYALGAYAGERGRPFAGGAVARTVYYVILWPHVVLAATVPFFAVRVFQHAAAERWDNHRRLARVAFPVWMYVSVTGVAIYGMLYHWPSSV
ncbi:MAG: DUF420 domain-containing protein [Planctomycetaceae bacterium]|jgi:protein SCO1/2